VFEPRIEKAAEKLHAWLQHKRWFVAVGVEANNKKLFIYCSNRAEIKALSSDITHWFCYPVVVKFCRKPKPA